MEDGGWPDVFSIFQPLLPTSFAAGALPAFPAAVHPEPVRRVAANGHFKFPVHIAHDVLGRTRVPQFMRLNLFAQLKPPFAQAHPETIARV